MFSKPARIFVMVLLVASLAAAPVWGAVPRCCETGAIAGGGNCCCGRKVQAEPERDCCAQRRSSCCQSDPAPPAQPLTPGRSSCCCKRTSPTPAVPTNNDRTQNRPESFADVVLIEPDLARAAEDAAASTVERKGPLKIPLRKIYCRWTV